MREITCMLPIVGRKIEAEEQRKAALQTLFKTKLHQWMVGQLRVPSYTDPPQPVLVSWQRRSETMTELRMSGVFTESANRLPKETRAKLPKVFMLLTSNPRHPSLQLKKIKGATRPDVYECRVDRSWRLILQALGEMTYNLVYVGAHDDAISHGARLRERGPRYGSSASILERVEAYLAGDDQALEFVSVSLDDLEALGT